MSEKRFLSGDEILAITDSITEELYIPEWDCWVRVRSMSAAERDQYEKSCLIGKGKDREFNLNNARAKLVARTVVDETGKRLWSDEKVAALGLKSSAAISRIFDKSCFLSGISDEDVKELTDDLKENPTEGSPTV